MQIFVKYNTTRVYDVKPDDTIKILKEKIYEKEALPEKVYWLSFKGNFLESNRYFSDYLIEEGSTIYLSIRGHNN